MRNKNSIIFYNTCAPYYKIYSHSKDKYKNSIDNLIVSSSSTNNISFIDIGCADGLRTKKLGKMLKVKKIYFVDNSPQMHKLYLSKNRSSFLSDISQEKIPIKEKANLITCLWNVLGHIENKKNVINALINMKDELNDRGDIFLDINNRYNYKTYGIRNVIINIFRDVFNYKWENGNFKVTIKIGEKKIDGFVHIFNPFEFLFLVKKADLKIKKIRFVDYETGKISLNPFAGQIFLQLNKK